MWKIMQRALLGLLVIAILGCSRGTSEQAAPTATAVDSPSAATGTPTQPAAIAEPYTEEEVTFQDGDVVLAGTLTLPGTAEPHPAVILLTGSGMQDRDEAHPSVPGYKPFAWIAGALAREGIAVLRYDDRGYGESQGGEQGKDTTADYAGDAQAALNFLRSRPEIAAGEIGLLGHSEGAHIAALVAAENPQVAFVVSVAGHAVDGASVLQRQVELIGEIEGLPEAEIQRMLDSNAAELAMIQAEDWEGLRAHLSEATREYLQNLPAGQQPAEQELDAQVEAMVAGNMVFMQGWLHYFVTHNPAEDWARVEAPVLAVFGGKDTQVEPAQNLAPMEAALESGGNADVTTIVFPDANHLFQAAKTGGPQEYTELPMEFLPGFLDTISDWILARVDEA